LLKKLLKLMSTPICNNRAKLAAVIAALALTPALASAGFPATSSLEGDYLEVRSCDVYTGYCFANAEMGLAGKEAMLVWSINRGEWEGTPLAGLKVIAVVTADETLGDVQFQPRRGRAVIITDAAATPGQQRALVEFARSMAGPLVADIEKVRSAPITAVLGSCNEMGCAQVKAPGLVEISTRCLGTKDHVCGNEETYYPPLTRLEHAMPAYSELAAFRGDALNVRWEGSGQRNVFLGQFSR
jgi:hypothetical protein